MGAGDRCAGCGRPFGTLMGDVACLRRGYSCGVPLWRAESMVPTATATATVGEAGGPVGGTAVCPPERLAAGAQTQMEGNQERGGLRPV